MGLSSFTYIEYTGEDAGDVLNKLISDSIKGISDDGPGPKLVEVAAAGPVRNPIGFAPNPGDDEQEEDEDDDS